jgi:hypothetical protein
MYTAKGMYTVHSTEGGGCIVLLSFHSYDHYHVYSSGGEGECGA